MTKPNSTLITLVLDRSGSMESCRMGTIEGFNAFIDSQKQSQAELKDEVKVSLVQFDTEYEINYNMLPLENVPKLDMSTFIPRGGTGLYDAIGKTINDVGSKLRDMSESDRPSKVLVVIMTDGGENASHYFNRHKVFEMIRHQEEKYAWEFVYIGANQDSFAVGSSLGVKTANTANYFSTNEGTRAVYASIGAMSSGYRGGKGIKLDQN